MSESTDLIEYIAALHAHDWSFEFTDDMTVWRAGRESLRRLDAMQREIDPDFAVWNDNCPLECIDGNGR